jgi:dihydroorotase
VPENGSKTYDITVFKAEQTFLSTLMELHNDFPELRVMLDHCTTCGATVGATISHSQERTMSYKTFSTKIASELNVMSPVTPSVIASTFVGLYGRALRIGLP